jgi:germination protein M
MKKIIPLLIIATVLYLAFNYLDSKLGSNDEADSITSSKQTTEQTQSEEENNDAQNSDILTADIDYFTHIVYYADSNGYLVPVLRKLPKNPSLAKTTLSALSINENNKEEIYFLGLVPTIPDKVTFSLALKDDGLIRVSMSGEVMDIKDKAKEELVLKSIVYTLTEFENISKIQFLVDNTQAGVLSGGVIASGYFKREDINTINAAGKNRISLYYSNTYYPNYYVFPITLYVDTAPEDIQSLLMLLIDNAGNVKTNFSLKEENILTAEIKDKKINIELENVGGDSITIDCIRKCILLSLQENFDIDSVYIAIDGESQSVMLPIAPNELN